MRQGKRPSLKDELDKLHGEIQRAGKVDMPTRATIFGRPKEPIGICSKCKKMLKISELQKYYTDPESVFWLCPRCAFKRKMREKFAGKL